jgi:hypothetical protein
MGKEITPEEAIALFGRLAEILAVNQERIGIPPMNKLLGTIKQRVFVNGLATDGKKISNKYSDGYAQKRELNRRQTDYVDLEMEGDLRLAMKTGIDEDAVVISIEGKKEIEKAVVLEHYYLRDIFKPSDKEIDLYVSEVEKELDIILKEL